MFNSLKTDFFNGSLSYATLMLFSGSAAGIVIPVTADAPGFKDKVDLLQAALQSKSTEMIYQAEKYEKELSNKNELINSQSNQLKNASRSIASLEAKVSALQTSIQSPKSLSPSTSVKDAGTPAQFISSSQVDAPKVNPSKDSKQGSPISNKDTARGSTGPRNTNPPSVQAAPSSLGPTTVTSLGTGGFGGASTSAGSSSSAGGDSSGDGGSSGGGGSTGGGSGGGSADTTGPTVTITSTTTSPSATAPFPITITFSESVADFTQIDISITNATISGFAGSGTTYTFNATPTGQGSVSINIPAAIANDAAGNDNLAATGLSITYDSVGPVATITSTETSPTITSPIPITVTFNEAATGFTSGDVTVGNGTASNFAGSGTTYTFDVTPTAQGNVTVDIAGSVAIDALSNNNPAATQFVIYFDQQIPVLNTIATKNFPSNQVIIGGTALTLDYNDIRLGVGSPTDAGMAYTCYYDKVIDGAVATTNQCDGSGATIALPGTVTFAAATGILSWTPRNHAYGPYEIKVIGARGAPSDNEIIIVDVQQAYTVANLRGDYDAQFADLTKMFTAAGVCSATGWLDLGPGARNIAGASCAIGAWNGTGVYNDPFRLTFDGSATSKADLGSAIVSGQTKMMFNTWIAPGAATALDKAILGDGGGAGNGFILRQSQTLPGRLELAVGRKTFAYRDLVLSDKPVGYWRLDETAGMTATDISMYGRNGTYTNGPTLNQTSAQTTELGTSVQFINASSTYINAGFNLAPIMGTTASLEFWIKTTQTGSPLMWQSPGVTGVEEAGWGNDIFWGWIDDTGRIGIRVGDDPSEIKSSNPINDNQWYHIVITRNHSTGIIEIYANGILNASTTSEVGAKTNAFSSFGRIEDTGGTPEYFNGLLDEVSIYDYVLNSTQIANHFKAGTNAADRLEMPANAVLADKPVNLWRLGETSGSVAIDSTGSKNGTYIASTTLGASGAITGDTNTGASFNGSTDYVSMNDSGLPSGTAARSVSFWAKPSLVNGAYHMAFAYGVYTFNQYFGVGIEPSNTWFVSQYGSSVVGGAADLNTWQHIVATYDGTTYRLYKNGAQVASGSMATGTVLSGSMTIARDPSATLFAGTIDEVAIYDYPLSPTQINSQYNAGGVCLESS